MTRTRQFLCGLVVAASIAATAAPSAFAMPADPFTPEGSSSGADATAQPVHVVQVTPDSGFDWRDAEIGAGTLLVVGLIGAGGAFAVKNRRRRARLATTT
jgi:hypothetical protein